MGLLTVIRNRHKDICHLNRIFPHMGIRHMWDNKSLCYRCPFGSPHFVAYFVQCAYTERLKNGYKGGEDKRTN